jgi:2-methylisocitrate lyase-like PEP mutase family enzyme
MTDFHNLHAGPRPLLLANAWDATSARVAAAAGAAAIGTSSFAVAVDHGVWDGQRLGFEEVVATAAAIAAAVDIPVSVDIEHGGADVAATVRAVVDAGAVGVNIEDVDPAAPGVLVDAEVQANLLAAARSVSADLYINARCDIWFGAAAPDPLDEAIRRARAYREAGADGLFVPGLLDLEVLRTLCGEVGMPVNVMVGQGMPSVDALAEVGVRRVSQGGESFLAAIGAHKLQTERYLSGALSSPGDVLGAGASLLGALTS